MMGPPLVKEGTRGLGTAALGDKLGRPFGFKLGSKQWAKQGRKGG